MKRLTGHDKVPEPRGVKEEKLTYAPHRARHPRNRPVTQPVRRVPQRNDRIGSPRGQVSARGLQLGCQACGRVALESKLWRIVALAHAQHRLELGVRQDPYLALRRGDENLLPAPAKGNLVCLHSLLV